MGAQTASPNLPVAFGPGIRRGEDLIDVLRCTGAKDPLAPFDPTAPDIDPFRASYAYVESRSASALGEFEAEFEYIFDRVGRFHAITADTQIFEVGAGLGWLEIICAKRGLSCSAIELNPIIRGAAIDLARRHGVDVDIALADIERVDLGHGRYDVVIATSVFEHVRKYGLGLAKIYHALRPGGVFYFYSTNKFSLRSGEYPDFPLYGWLSYPIRRRIRVSRQGMGIVESSGMDFNQFTYWGMSRHLKSLGYSTVVDQVDYVRPTDLSVRTPARTLVLRAAKALPPVKVGVRTFAPGTSFICVK